ncbi:glycoside hydrolase family 19 protein [Pseudomonas capsici]|uniref:Chitinase n=1 Tax=Pseudomonas capsici TaxID=2810614 RepID=A0ABT3BY81_9PSED|nr:hypothetical protein [Pseudomonas capsici]MCV4265979.1 hypothetical protein [Pseudomonas capsici]MCV4277416.1 hypothetical protein [Pseudomonas capsici]MCV4330640.1 hypothetical protein [Pseudomonas capsici]MCV4377814.1 hypothetical protein [Pseudomonas capsici]
MSTGLLEQRANYPHTGYEYGFGKNGNVDVDGDGRKEIDCSHLLSRMLSDAGYTIPYRTTGALATDTVYYDVIALNDVKPGDIALWTTLGHTGVIEEMDATRTKGRFFGSQTSTGPKSAKFGAGSGYWPMPNKYLRPKAQYRNGAPADPAPAPTPAPAPAPTASPLINFQYPFRKADGKQFTDAEEIYKALEGEASGHYLLGSNKFWHGGIHISDKSAPQCISNEPIRCMADGEVVAYRLNQDYLESTFGDNEKKLKYSNSFCLVRHEYKSPPNPDEGPNKGKQNKLNFYSLYMHLLPYDRYAASPDEIPAPRIRMIASGFKARSDIKDAPNCVEYGAISAGAEIEILEEHADLVHAKGKLVKGNVGGRTEGQEFWFAYKQNGAPYPRSSGAPSWSAVVPPERTRPGYWKGKVRAVVTGSGLTLRQPPASLTNGAESGVPISAPTAQGTSEGLVLCTNSTIEFDSGKVLNLKLGNKTLRMAECTFVPSTSGPATGLKGHSVPVPSSFWACVEDVSPNRFVQWQDLIPSVFDEVVPIGTAIKAGDPIGYLGLNENISGPNGGVSSKYQVHVEIFSADSEVEIFLKNQAGLKDGKQYIHLPAATILSKKAPQTDTVVLSKEHFVELRKAVAFKDTVDWYEITVVDNGEGKTGLLKKESAKLISQHDWELLGFKIVKETNQTSDGFLDIDDMPDFFKAIYSDLDKLGNNDGKVTVEDLPIALKNLEFREHWSKLIADHPTEWKSKSDAPKWSRLSELLEDSPAVLKHEKERIDKLIFWDDLTGNAKIGDGGGVVKHFHPISFVCNLMAGVGVKLTLAMLKKVFTTGDSSKLQQLVDELNPRLAEYKLDTPLRLSHFFAQVRIEVGDGYALVESLNYRPEKLTKFSYFSARPEEADLYGYKPGIQSANQVEIANRAYNGVSGVTDLGNGNIASGDGWKYRGRGLKQLTGRYNYTQFTSLYPEIWPGENTDFVSNPDLLEEPKYAARSAVFFWLKNKLYEIADKGEAAEFVNAITAKINRHTDSYGDRRAQFTRIWTNEKIFQ